MKKQKRPKKVFKVDGHKRKHVPKTFEPKWSKTVNRDNKIYYANSYVDTVKRANGTSSTSGIIALGNSIGFIDYVNTVSTSTPNYRSIKKSQLPWHPYSYNYWRANAPLANYTHIAEQGTDVHTSVYSCTACYLGVDANSFDVSLEADDPTQQAVYRLLNGYQSADGSVTYDGISNQKAQTGVMMAELHKTAFHLVHTVQRVHKAITALKHGRFGDFAEALNLTVTTKQRVRFDSKKRKAFSSEGYFTERPSYLGGRPIILPYQKSRMTDLVADTWLEYSYGWKPLLKDVYDHAVALGVLLVEHQGVVRSARVSVKNGRERVLKEDDGTKYRNTTSSSLKTVRFAIDYRIPDGAVSPNVAFGLLNPMSIAWELVPFSFVADWFLPIGQAIEALTATNGLVFVRGTKTAIHEFERHISFTPNGKRSLSGGVYYTVTSCGQKYDEFRTSKIRTVLSSFPTPGMPKWQDPRSIKHAASAIALLQSIFLRK